MSERERYYDEHIAPKLKALSEECREAGIPFIAVCEWGQGSSGTTAWFQPENSSMQLVYLAAQVNGNVDRLLWGIDSYAKKYGHSSVELYLRGIPETPVTNND